MRQSLGALVRIERKGFVGLRERLHELPTQKATLRVNSTEPEHTHQSHTISHTNQEPTKPHRIPGHSVVFLARDHLGTSHSTLRGSPYEPKCFLKRLKRQSRKIVELGSHLFTIPIEKPLSKHNSSPSPLPRLLPHHPRFPLPRATDGRDGRVNCYTSGSTTTQRQK